MGMHAQALYIYEALDTIWYPGLHRYMVCHLLYIWHYMSLFSNF